METDLDRLLALKRDIDAWLAAEGLETQTPREALSEAYRAGWLDDETAWLTMLRDRNRTSHTYDEALAEAVYQDIGLHVRVLDQATVCILE